MSLETPRCNCNDYFQAHAKHAYDCPAKGTPVNPSTERKCCDECKHINLTHHCDCHDLSLGSDPQVSTTEDWEKDVIETTERIVIACANWSGRADNRSQFRQEVEKLISSLLKAKEDAAYERGVKDHLGSHNLQTMQDAMIEEGEKIGRAAVVEAFLETYPGVKGNIGGRGQAINEIRHYFSSLKETE